MLLGTILMLAALGASDVGDFSITGKVVHVSETRYFRHAMVEPDSGERINITSSFSKLSAADIANPVAVGDRYIFHCYGVDETFQGYDSSKYTFVSHE